MTSASAPGKIILFGEHAVVYGRPAIAVPIHSIRATATITPRAAPGIFLDARDLGQSYALADAARDDPLGAIIRATLQHLRQNENLSLSISITSTIPLARGMGSGAAVSVAVARALSKHLARDLSNAEISALAFEVEKLHHGTPSGIDNTVIAFEQPIYFVRGQPIETLKVGTPLLFAIADTGVPSPTKVAVGDVRRAWGQDRARYENLFDEVGVIVRETRTRLAAGDVEALGLLMNRNQELLREIGVSSPEIEQLIRAAEVGGARGAKLSGAGRGGNIIALIDTDVRARVERALLDAGAVRVIVTEVG
jgi:mevalonate kinase